MCYRSNLQHVGPLEWSSGAQAAGVASAVAAACTSAGVARCPARRVLKEKYHLLCVLHKLQSFCIKWKSLTNPSNDAVVLCFDPNLA